MKKARKEIKEKERAKKPEKKKKTSSS